MNLKISPDRMPNPKPIRNPNTFAIPNPMPLTYDFLYSNQIRLPECQKLKMVG